MNKLLSKNLFQLFTTSKRHYQVTVAGGASDVGQTLCLLLRTEPAITRLVIHDSKAHTPGVVLDVSHIPGEVQVQGYTGDDTLDLALKNAHVVIAAGGLVRKPGIPEKLWLSNNTAFIKTLSMRVAKMNPAPFLGIITEPINCLVPIATEVLTNNGTYDPRKLFGITGVDALRAQTLYADENNISARNCIVPVIGGHSENTLIPLLSQSHPASPTLDAKMSQDFTLKYRKFDEKIINAKRGHSPVLSVAYSALLFTRSVLNALDGRRARVHAFIENNDFGTAYFGGLVDINNEGVKEMIRYTTLTEYECHLLEQSFQELRKDVLKGKKVLELT
ncbi:malate dehydrogenase-like [Spodoptera frugiperda]|uniref:Malate dehydrogenase, mitochondrial n=1 Tax=Spodoptera frugiperda TaxID=7108 RepID=A0A9R0CX33_SPOFR|nr:malate dehydrogenase-like [Spodoptera frugiperda]